MKIENARLIVALAETGSFSAAALRCGVTQPAVSHTIRRMEAELGQKLFVKSGGRYVPTDAGRISVKYAREMLKLESRFLDELTGLETVKTGRLTLLSSNIPGEYVIPGVITEFRQDFPSIEILIEITDSSRVLKQVKEGKSEIGFIGSPHKPAGLSARPFCPDNLVLACGPNHPLARKKKLSFQEIAEEKWILREEGSGTRDLMLEALGEIGISPASLNTVMELGSTSAVISAVESGAGISMISNWAARNPVAEGRLAIVNVSGLKAERNFLLVNRKTPGLSANSVLFKRFLLSKKSFFENQLAEMAIRN